VPRITKKQRVRQWAAERGWTIISETEWSQLRAALPHVSENTIREAGIPVAPPWRGVRQHTIEELEESLCELSAVCASRPDLRRYCRELVIEAKDRARWAGRSARTEESQQKLKAEMVEWMLVWLDDPSMFPMWAELRRERMRAERLIIEP
jgi:hypothetical protein